MIRTQSASKRLGFFAAAMALALTTLAPFAATADSEPGPVWRIWNARVDEDKMDDYLRYLTKVYSHKLAAWKEAGLLTDYMIIVADPQGKDDWNISFMYQYKNMAALDVPDEVWAKAGRKAMEKVEDQEAKSFEDKYHEWREFLGVRLSRQVNLSPQ